MKSLDKKIQNAIKNMSFSAGPELDKDLWAETSRTHNEFHTIELTSDKQNMWRIIMKSKMIRYSAAAVIFLIILGGITFRPFDSLNKEQWWLGTPAVWGQEIIMELDNIETLVYREQYVFVSPYGSTHVSGTWRRHYQAKDRAVIEMYYEHTDEDTFGDVKPDSILQNVTYNFPDGNDLISYNLSYEHECYSIRELEEGAYKKDPVEDLRFYVNLLVKADRIMEMEIFDGKKCIGFEISAAKYGDNPPDWIDRIWLDIQTKLPVRIEKHGRPITDRTWATSTEIQDQFIYYADIPVDLFEPKIPVNFIYAESSDIQKAKEEMEKGQMVYAEVPPELVDATAQAMNSVGNVIFWQHIGIFQDNELKYIQSREQLVSRYDWQENVYFNEELQKSQWFITSQSDFGKTSFDFNDKNFSIAQIIVNHNRHTYKTTTYNSSSHPDNPLDRIIFLIDWFSKADIFIENEEIDGRECYGFELSAKKYGTNPDTTKHRLWFDKQTNLPVRIEDEWLEDDGPRMIVKDQFEWDVELPQETFIPDIPTDYTPEEE